MQPSPAKPEADPMLSLALPHLTDCGPCSQPPSSVLQRIPARPPPSVQRHYPAMPPSSALPGGCKRTSSFGSVDWLSQSSHTGLAHTSRPAEVSWGSLSASAQVYYRGEPHQTADMEEAKLSEVSAPGTPAAGRCGDGSPGGGSGRGSHPGHIRVPWSSEGHSYQG